VNKIDFAALIKPLSFGQEPRDDASQQAKGGLVTRALRRRMAFLREAQDVLTVLPGPGETLHSVVTGSFDLAHLLTVLLDKLGSPCVQMRVATLSLSPKNVAELSFLLDARKVTCLDVLVSDFFRKHDGAIFAELLQEMGKRGQRVASARSHCKIVTIALGDGRRFTVEASMNLRSNGNAEQLSLTQDEELYRWADAWLSRMVTEHEIRQSNCSEAG
jgi:hypothetical protein